MQLELSGKKYDIYMGIASLNYLDKVYTIKDQASGIEFGAGVEFLISSLNMGNMMAMVHFIKAGTETEKSKPSNKAIEDFIGSLSDEELEELFSEAVEEIKKQPLTKHTVNKMEKRIKGEEKA